MWILGSPRQDILFLYLPGTLAILIATLFPNISDTSVLYALFATAIVDSGHVYTTLWRTYLHRPERTSTKLYLFTPLAIAITIAAWAYSGFPYLWSFIVYATLYHHIRQFYGFSKWYQHLNKRSRKPADYYLYALSLLPILAYHFRPNVMAGFYSTKDLLLYPHQVIHTTILAIYSVTLIAWLTYELRLIKQNQWEPGRLLAMLMPITIYAYCFLIGQTIAQVLFPLLLSHGIAYFAVMSQSLVRTQKQRFKAFLPALIAVTATASALGLSESWIEETFIDFNSSPNLNQSPTPAIAIGLYLTPLLTHFIIDSWIWRRKHREAKEVFTPTPPHPLN